MKSTCHISIISIIIFSIIIRYNCEEIKKEFKILKCQQNKIEFDVESGKNEEVPSRFDEAKRGIQKLVSCSKNVFDSKVQDIKQMADKTQPKESIKDSHILELLTEGIKKANEATVQEQNSFFESKLNFIDVPLSKPEATFKTFAPDNFSSLRAIYNVDEDFKNSLNDPTPFILQDTGSTDSKQFYTADYKFTIKTISNGEQQVLTSMLSDYFSHFCENPNSLLPKISGLYYFKFNYVQHFVIITPSVYPYPLQKTKNKQYFLKGADNEALLKEDKGDQSFRLLERNFLYKYPKGFTVSSSIHNNLKEILEIDCKLLKKIEVTNYSLAVVLSKVEKSIFNWFNPLTQLKIGSFFEQIVEKNDFIVDYDTKSLTVFIGIQNVLHKYNLTRQLENKLKGTVLRRGDKATVQEPEIYADRFIKFITGNVFVQTPAN